MIILPALVINAVCYVHHRFYVNKFLILQFPLRGVLHSHFCYLLFMLRELKKGEITVIDNLFILFNPFPKRLPADLLEVIPLSKILLIFSVLGI